MARYRFQAEARVSGYIVAELDDDSSVEDYVNRLQDDPSEVLQLLLDQGSDASDADIDTIDIEVKNKWVWWPAEN